MSAYDDLRLEVGNIQAMGGSVEEILLGEDVQYEIVQELCDDGGPDRRITQLFDCPVHTTERGTGVRIKYH